MEFLVACYVQCGLLAADHGFADTLCAAELKPVRSNWIIQLRRRSKYHSFIFIFMFHFCPSLARSFRISKGRWTNVTPEELMMPT